MRTRGQIYPEVVRHEAESSSSAAPSTSSGSSSSDSSRTPEPSLSDPPCHSARFMALRKLHRRKDGVARVRGQPGFYHEDYLVHGVADLPDFHDVLEESEYREDDMMELCLSKEPQSERNMEELHKKALEMSHLPPDITLQLLAHFEYNLRQLEKNLKGLEVPDLVPDYAKRLIGANIAEERELHSRKTKKARKFFFSETLEKSVDRKSLVDFYYKEKNKVKSNWKLQEEKDDDLAQDEEEKLVELMEKANIKIFKADGSVSTAPVGQRHRRASKPAAPVREHTYKPIPCPCQPSSSSH